MADILQRYGCIEFMYTFLYVGHSNGAIQMWDLTTALDFFNKNEKSEIPNQGLQQMGGNKVTLCSEQGGPTTQELVS